MNRKLLAACALALLFFGGVSMVKHNGGSASASDPSSSRLLRHVVLFQFKSTLGESEIREVVTAFQKLPSAISQIHDFEWGTDISVENKAAGYTHAFLVTFKSVEDRDEYLPHAAHQEFVKLAGPRLQNVLVFDYWSGK